MRFHEEISYAYLMVEYLGETPFNVLLPFFATFAPQRCSTIDVRQNDSTSKYFGSEGIHKFTTQISYVHVYT